MPFATQSRAEQATARDKRRIEAEAAPVAPVIARLDEIPGISLVAAHTILAEIGADMTRFTTAGHLVSWAKYAPGVRESAGKKKGRNSTGHGNPVHELDIVLAGVRRKMVEAARVVDDVVGPFGKVASKMEQHWNSPGCSATRSKLARRSKSRSRWTCHLWPRGRLASGRTEMPIGSRAPK